jgi:hypothetical protein
VDLDEILYGCDGIEYYLDYILFNPVASAIPKWRTFKVMGKLGQTADSKTILVAEN